MGVDPAVSGYCPSCGRDELVLGGSGRIRCSAEGCSAPTVAASLLDAHGDDAGFLKHILEVWHQRTRRCEYPQVLRSWFVILDLTGFIGEETATTIRYRFEADAVQLIALTQIAAEIGHQANRELIESDDA